MGYLVRAGDDVPGDREVAAMDEIMTPQQMIDCVQSNDLSDLIGTGEPAELAPPAEREVMAVRTVRRPPYPDRRDGPPRQRRRETWSSGVGTERSSEGRALPSRSPEAGDFAT